MVQWDTIRMHTHTLIENHCQNKLISETDTLTVYETNGLCVIHYTCVNIHYNLGAYLIFLWALNHPFPNTVLSLKLSWTLANVLSLCLRQQFGINSLLRLNTFRKNWKHICWKLPFHHNCSAVPCSKDNFCPSPTMTSQMILFVAPLSLNMLRI